MLDDRELASRGVPLTAPEPTAAASDGQAAVVVIHGLGSHRLLMTPLARRLAGRFHVVNWGYNSLRGSTAGHAAALRQRLEGLCRDDRFTTVHLVGHSMGGIVARAALAAGPWERLGRLVMLCPPNHGSYLATYFASTLGRLLPPVAELADSAESWVNRLPERLPIDVGVIAARADALVRESATHLAGERGHITLPGRHALLPFRRETAEWAAAFLLEGRFPSRLEPPRRDNSQPAQ